MFCTLDQNWAAQGPCPGVAECWGRVRTPAASGLTSVNLGLPRDLQLLDDLGAPDGTNPEGLLSPPMISNKSVLFCFVQSCSWFLFCRKVTGEYCCLPRAFSCRHAILSAPVPEASGISHSLREAAGLEEPLAQRASLFLCSVVFLCLSGHSGVGLSPTYCASVMIWGCACLQTHEYLIWKEGRTVAKGRMGFAQANSIFACWFCHFFT